EILRGREARPHARPYMAFVKTETGGNQRSRCGGFLSREDVVVRVAHCNCNLQEQFQSIARGLRDIIKSPTQNTVMRRMKMTSCCC
ncbi:unnamed protein product, partial [Natator depressus]